jgi:hypothetical protein
MKVKYIPLVEQFLLTNDVIIYMTNKSLSKFTNTDCSFEDSGKKYLGLYADSYFFQWVAFDDPKGEYDFTYSQATEIGKQLDENLAKYIWKYGKIEDIEK